KRLVIGVDRERDLGRAPLDARSQRARGLESKMTRARREKYESDHIGPRFQRDIERLRGPEAADFDGQSHDGRLLAPYPLCRKAAGQGVGGRITASGSGSGAAAEC